MLKPNNTGILAGAPYITNTYGFRGNNYSKEKPQEVIRVAAVGDSVTFGYGVLDNETFPKILESNLTTYCNKTFEVINFGTPGYNFRQEYYLIEEEVLSYNPDIILILYVLNDPMEILIDDTAFSKKSVLAKALDKLNVYLFLKKSKEINSFYYNGKKQNILEFYNSLYHENSQEWEEVMYYAEKLNQLNLKSPAGFYVFIMPELDRLNKKYPFFNVHSKIFSELNEAGLETTDLLSDFEGKDAMGLRVHKLLDGHPNREGHMIIAEGILRRLILKEVCMLNESTPVK